MNSEPLSKAYDPTEVEGRWYSLWQSRGYFRAEAKSDKPPFCIVLPPPNVTGSLHLGHALTATIQDILSRWKRMSGYNVLWLPGTDHAGIATQMVVEKELKRTEGKSRHDLGRQAFLERVWQWKEKFGARIGEQHKVLGASLDWSRERFTMDEGLSAAVREVFVRLYEEGLIYRAQKLINWCPSCRTALSDLEVEHEERDGSLWHIRYPVVGSNESLVVATTRPETMLGDTAVAVHPEDPRYRHLIGQKVALPLAGREIPIVGDAELVNMEFGTGAVKVTPGHDFNDYQVGLRHQLPLISIFDEAARTTKEAGDGFVGLDRAQARVKVLEVLTGQSFLVKEDKHRLSVGTCQRCATVVEPRLSPQWFVKIEPLAQPAIAAVEQGKTRFVPETWTQTYFAWMRNIHDWCISRQLWWGHQIPAYYCLDCSPKPEGEGPIARIDRSRATPVVSRTLPRACAVCGGSAFEQDPDVLDTWFSSGLWPFSTLGWPDQTDELRTFYPTSVMETGHDIIFFWVARMMMMGLHFMKEVPFRTVYLHAMVRDEKGEKMSKTKGNVIDPLDVIRGAKPEALLPNVRNKFPGGMPAFGADALRFTLASLTQQGRDIKLSLDRVSGYKAFCNKLWNAARFALMNLGDFRFGFMPDASALSLADRWILSRLNGCMERTAAALEAYQFAEAAGTVYQFVWREFCDWYIEMAKGALYGENVKAKDSARAVLVFCLDRILRLLHPFMPFVTEEIWQKLPLDKSVESICVAEYPRPQEQWMDQAAEEQMAPLVEAIEGIRTIRGESNLPPAQKLRAIIQAKDPAVRQTLDQGRHYLLPLAGLSELTVEPPAAKPLQSAVSVGERMEVFVPLAGLIDFAEERARIQKELTKVGQDLSAVERKLQNPSFVERAPEEVVVETRERLAELKARQQKLQEHHRRLSSEDSMVEERRPDALANADSATVKIAPVVQSGSLDLGAELKEDIEGLDVPEGPDPEVANALDKLKEGTEEGLSARDHQDLGVAYLNMGMVDEAVREFTQARAPAKKKRSPKKTASAARAKKKPKVAPKAKRAKVKKAKVKNAKVKKAKKAPARKKVAKPKAKLAKKKKK